MNEYQDPQTYEQETNLLPERIEPQPPALRVVTPQEARNESIAHTLDAAYSKASTLQLTPEEAKALMAEFDDSDIRTGARGKENLIYLEHAAVRRRLMEVFGPGQWTIINRRSWLDEQGGWLYADIVLICRGCFVGECIGANRYSSGNKLVNYSDAVKGAESDALGRIAGTALGVGLQLWSKGFSEAWHERNSGGSRNAPRQYTTPTPRPAPKPAPQPNVERTAAAPADVLPAQATPKTRDWAWNTLTAQFPAQQVWDYLAGKGWVPEDGTFDLWPLEHVPTSKAGLQALIDEIQKTAPQVPANQQNDGNNLFQSGDLPPEIGDAVITVPRRGMKRADYMQNPDTIQSLYTAMKGGDQEAQKRLWGMVKGWNPEPYVDGNGKKWPVKQEDFDCRVSLDLFAEWHKEHHGESEQ